LTSRYGYDLDKMKALIASHLSSIIGWEDVKSVDVFEYAVAREIVTSTDGEDRILDSNDVGHCLTVKIGFRNEPAALRATVHTWHTGRYQVTMVFSEERELLSKLVQVMELLSLGAGNGWCLEVGHDD
jgi:hypothetical protein